MPTQLIRPVGANSHQPLALTPRQGGQIDRHDILGAFRGDHERQAPVVQLNHPVAPVGRILARPRQYLRLVLPLGRGERLLRRVLLLGRQLVVERWIRAGR
ncbi:MAG: hypothetical protein ACR2IP_09695 [Solirubrobacteraceae bacterium]